MNRREIRKWLMTAGFISVRQGKHETFDLNGHRIIIPSSGKELNWRLEKMIKIQVRKAMENLSIHKINMTSRLT